MSVQVSSKDRERYRTRKGHLAMNVLGVCSPDMQFIYVLPGWEGSAHDGRVLRDAISRPHGLRISQGMLTKFVAEKCFKLHTQWK